MKPSVLLAGYRVMAYVTAVLLIALCVAMVGKYGWPSGTDVQHAGEAATTTIGIAHGWLYMVYLVLALLITRLLRVPVGPMLLVLLAGTIPFGAFFAERRVVQWFRTWNAAKSGPGAGAAEQTGSAHS
ncbi:integral membrane protein [Actinopolyspora biskrensis]|uniref:Integral membrane protein n=1 Tax=Actinopolyspora biskrensis TaxID=1470178 RepID=A0A852Z307_9ACTN|nr:integral membrane protein [Actinopolyspora biskrensis]